MMEEGIVSISIDGVEQNSLETSLVASEASLTSNVGRRQLVVSLLLWTFTLLNLSLYQF